MRTYIFIVQPELVVIHLLFSGKSGCSVAGLSQHFNFYIPVRFVYSKSVLSVYLKVYSTS